MTRLTITHTQQTPGLPARFTLSKHTLMCALLLSALPSAAETTAPDTGDVIVVTDRPAAAGGDYIAPGDRKSVV